MLDECLREREREEECFDAMSEHLVRIHIVKKKPKCKQQQRQHQQEKIASTQKKIRTTLN